MERRRKNFINGVFNRLHPQGSHPGLLDEEDCTFWVHLVLLVVRFFSVVWTQRWEDGKHGVWTDIPC
ncbi:MAG: hypothetical protein HY000_10925 [Planctomycetes bacterium]|nr:hypothetical protein [Planctomycetota bacterium]